MNEQLCGAELLASVKQQHYPNVELNHGGLLSEHRATTWSETCLEMIQGVKKTDKEVDKKSESLTNILPGYPGFGRRNKTQSFRKEGMQVLLAQSVPCI